jgi:small basic protein
MKINISTCNSCIAIGNFIITKFEAIMIPIITALSFILTYFFNITIENYQQYIAIVSVVFLDGLFGIIAGIKKEGFMTKKALKVLRTGFTWILILSVLLAVEKGINGTLWLSETFIIPFIVFQLISAVKNASMAGYIEHSLLNDILDKIDLHKGNRKDTSS